MDCDDDVEAALRTVDRRGFLPRAALASAGQDRPLAIGHGQTCSQPSTVAAMLRLLDVHPGARVLDVGAGSGWTTALLAHLVGPDGRVLGVERRADLAAWGATNLARHGMPWASEVAALPGVLGWPRDGGWERILVSAAARRLPAPLVAQIAPGGRMVIPVGHTMTCVRVGPDGFPHLSEHGTYAFVPLIEE
ncbi:protein-L-isoaspartate carboxylmethyltransferase [Xylanimonas allomyrinae]|uniref:Protein-L-isoaspartate O-methyltransferase n=1 Tax=Xylanimonas allomyrinae TaxID=2509459 RepID=A0A4P6EVQ7_9MICO|nr:protein-L-isoaspartate carboxylmethyltransferase [Xylanimonas allomyrinae]QAY62118.1 protein-L-isoaspartate carboxylmethyltransferase [Xylanimonas allomyrinae]